MHCGMTDRFALVRLLVLATIWLCGSGSLLAQTFSTIHLFGGGGSPRGTLVEGSDGNLYGTTYGSGGRNNGMIFKITPSTVRCAGREFGSRSAALKHERTYLLAEPDFLNETVFYTKLDPAAWHIRRAQSCAASDWELLRR